MSRFWWDGAPRKCLLESTMSLKSNAMRSIDAASRSLAAATACLAAALLPRLALAQASPFLAGANALQQNILTWLTPIAIILVMVLGAMAMANRMSWGWCLAAILGIAIAFGAPQIVTWVRGMFGV
ncbi:MAG TPA: TrbC/VirB2 family protein [Steroidobacteraceae bacterium]|jgi:type IV secretion system protein VirB2